MDLFSFDKKYVDRLRNGDVVTEQHFVSYFQNLLQVKLRARMLSPSVAAELQNETVARAIAGIRRGDGIDQPDRLAAFVNAVCNNVMLEFYRLGRSVAHSESLKFGKPPGSALRAIANLVCNKITVDKIVSPLLADMEFEYRGALATERKTKAAWVRVRYGWAFFCALSCHRVRRAISDLFLRLTSR